MPEKIAENGVISVKCGCTVHSVYDGDGRLVHPFQVIKPCAEHGTDAERQAASKVLKEI